MDNNVKNNYENRYSKNNSPKHIYPVEIIVRIFLGSYPDFKMDAGKFPNSQILDLGFGDGRNFPLLHNLGMHIAGVEISEDILKLAEKKFEALNIPLRLATGSNSNIPFPDQHFDYLLACHSLYYMNKLEKFEQVIHESARVLRSGAKLIATFPKPSSYILKNAIALPGGYSEITNDPLQLRNGSIFRVFESTKQIEEAFSAQFHDFYFASCEDNFFGLQQDFWAVVCSRK